jgi:hypothetical protein
MGEVKRGECGGRGSLEERRKKIELKMLLGDKKDQRNT